MNFLTAALILLLAQPAYECHLEDCIYYRQALRAAYKEINSADVIVLSKNIELMWQKQRIHKLLKRVKYLRARRRAVHGFKGRSRFLKTCGSSL